MEHALLAALQWDPQIRGYLIILMGLVLLPGSAYLLLSTNIGARVGFLLAAAGLTGWVFVMSVVWAVFGIGMVGRVPSWKAIEVDTGNVASLTTASFMSNFPRGWRWLKPSDAETTDAEAAADRVLAPGAAASKLPTPFKVPADYVDLAVYRKGGDNWLFTMGRHHVFLRHSPHYDVVEVQPVARTATLPGAAPPKPVPDVSKPITRVVMVRDLGSVRQPPILLALATGIIFGVSCLQLHRREKAILAANPAGAPSGSLPPGAIAAASIPAGDAASEEESEPVPT